MSHRDRRVRFTTSATAAMDSGAAQVNASRSNQPVIKTKSYLDRLPREIFARVASQLDSVWLCNLAKSYPSLDKLLSFEEGANKIWYNAMPPAIWNEPEYYQDENELYLRAATRGTQRVLDEPLLQNMGLASRRFVNTSGSTLAVTPYLPATLQRVGSENLTSLPRPAIKILGGPYQDWFNYRREIVGRMTDDRCHVCLIDTPRIRAFHLELKEEWNVRWCSDCLVGKTIYYTKVSHILGNDEILYALNYLEVQREKAFYYYAPDIDRVLGHFALPNLQMIDFCAKASRASCLKSLVESSDLEGRRRLVRLEIIRVAKCFWEGENPYPDILLRDGPESKLVLAGLVDERTFRVFRKRFAPTADLGNFLFPKYLIEEFPTKLQYMARNDHDNWLVDPTIKLVTGPRQALNGIAPTLIYSAAYKMLVDLTIVNGKYSDKGRGGSVQTWAKAAHDYHVERIQSHLDSNMIYHMEHIAKHDRKDEKFYRLNELRRRLGLHNALDDIVSEVRRPHINEYLHRDVSDFITAEKHAVAMENTRLANVKAFNKILRETCSICPVTTGLFHTMGLEGLLKHMLRSHPEIYWRTDMWTIVG